LDGVDDPNKPPEDADSVPPNTFELMGSTDFGCSVPAPKVKFVVSIVGLLEPNILLVVEAGSDGLAVSVDLIEPNRLLVVEAGSVCLAVSAGTPNSDDCELAGATDPNNEDFSCVDFGDPAPNNGGVTDEVEAETLPNIDETGCPCFAGAVGSVVVPKSEAVPGCSVAVGLGPNIEASGFDFGEASVFVVPPKIEELAPNMLEVSPVAAAGFDAPNKLEPPNIELTLVPPNVTDVLTAAFGEVSLPSEPLSSAPGANPSSSIKSASETLVGSPQTNPPDGGGIGGAATLGFGDGGFTGINGFGEAGLWRGDAGFNGTNGLGLPGVCRGLAGFIGAIKLRGEPAWANEIKVRFGEGATSITGRGDSGTIGRING
jgi:hypothetical protein